MNTSIFFGGSVVAAVIAGAISLFAPCCISVMLPAFFASSFQNRRLLVAMTFLFAAGIATIILPIAMGASFLTQLITGQHTVIYVVGGILILGLAIYTLFGGQLHLPMPGRRGGRNAGPAGVYSLGLFSGVASSCCAPVLAGVLALSSAASSFGVALGLGSAYVFGMVAPLFVISLLWERFDWRSSRIFRSRSISWRIRGMRRPLSLMSLASGLLLAAMGVGMVWVGLAYDAMPSSGGWQARLSARLQHYGAVTTSSLAEIPGWGAALVLSIIVAFLAWRAYTQLGWASSRTDPGNGAGRREELELTVQEQRVENERTRHV